MSTKYAVVMAAGKGTRMKSELPKVLCPVLGRPMIRYVTDALLEAGVEKIIVVVGYRGEMVRDELKNIPQVCFAEQTEQLGTGHAVMMCRDELQNYDGPVMVIAGDTPMIQVDSVRSIFNEYSQKESSGMPYSCILGTAFKDNPFGLGRILRDQNGDFLGIVEQRDATEEQQKITEINMSYYVFRTPDLLDALHYLKTDNAQGEYYITDVPKVLKSQGKTVAALPLLKPIEGLGVNTIDELGIVEDAMKNYLASKK